MKKITYLILILSILSCGRKSFDEQMEEQARDFTLKQCPREVDQFTTIDSLAYDRKTKTLKYYYTLKGELDDSTKLSPSACEDFEETMLSKLRNDLGLKKEKENGVAFEYNYYSQKTRTPLLCLHFDAEDYNGKVFLKTFNYRETRNMREFTRTNCPMRQDSCTVMDSVWYDSISRTLYYDYTLEGTLDDDSLYSTNPEIVQKLKVHLLKGVKNNDEIANERDKEKINFAFRYFSKSTKKLLIKHVIKQKDLK